MLSPAIAIVLLFACIFAVGIGFYCHRRSRQFYGTYPVSYSRTRFGAMTDHVRRAISPWSWKHSAHGRLGNSQAYSNSSSVLWPPTNSNSPWPVMQSELHGSYHQDNHQPHQQQRQQQHNHLYRQRPSSGSFSVNSVPGMTPVNTVTNSGPNGMTHPHVVSKASGGLDALTHLTHMRPTFMSRIRSTGSDVTKLLDAEELAVPSDAHGSPSKQPDVVFRDPLSGTSGGSSKFDPPVHPFTFSSDYLFT